MDKKLFYLTTEIFPFANTSDLGVFSTKVPLNLQEKGHDIRTIIPKYGFVSERKYILREVIRLREIPFDYNGQPQMVSAKSAFIPKTRVQVYFLEHNEWFKPLSNLLYKSKNGRPYSDNDERYAFFSKASITILPHLFWKPDIILCNNWPSALVPLFYKQQFADDEFYQGIKTVLMIHSLAEYVHFSRETFEKAGLILPESIKGDKINVYEAAAQSADIIIAIDGKENPVSSELMKLPGIKDVESKVKTIVQDDSTLESYLKVADSIDQILQEDT